MFQVNPLLAEDSHEKSTLFSSKDKSKNLKCRLLQFLFCAVRVKGILLLDKFITNMRFHDIFSFRTIT